MMRRVREAVVCIACLLSAACTVESQPAGEPGSAPAEVTLDETALRVSTAFLPGAFVSAHPGDTMQIATASSPGRRFSIRALHYGTELPLDPPVTVTAGGARALAARLWSAAPDVARDPDGPVAALFGEPVAGQLEVTHAPGADGAPESQLTAEWVTEAADRLWVIEAAWSEPGTLDLAAARNAVRDAGVAPLAVDTAPDGVTVTADALASAPSSVLVIGRAPWWSGNCNVNNHAGATLVNSAAPGLPACRAPDMELTRSFGTGGLPGTPFNVLEFQCVELSKRYLRLRQNVNPYSADGKTVVGNYSSGDKFNPWGPTLEVVTNGGLPPAPQPGDVLSYKRTTTNPPGHTSVVIASDVAPTGNGTVTVVEQNASAAGISTLPVTNWYVNGNYGDVSAWLVADQDYSPAIARDAGNQLAVFARGIDNHLYVLLQGAFGTDTWTPLGGNLRGNPSAVRAASLLEVFARNSDGLLVNNHQTSATAWSGFSAIDGSTKIQGSPLAIKNSGGGIDVLVWMADNQLGWAWKSCATCGWSAIAPVEPGVRISANPAAVVDDVGRVTVFARGVDGTLWVTAQTAPGSASWIPSFSLGGVLTSAPAAVRNTDGRLEVFVVGTDANLYHKWQTCPGCAFTDWVPLLTGSWTRTPIAATSKNGAVEVFAISATSDASYNNAPFHASQLDGWGGWHGLTGTFRASMPAVGIDGAGALWIVGRGDDRRLYYASQTAANAVTWTGWSPLGNATWP